MNNILFDYLDDFYTVYLDNILIYFLDLTKYIEYILKILTRLKKTEL